jgi:aminopeptidase N
MFSKGNPNENFDILINYDVLNTDQETMASKLQQLVSLTSLDRSGRINMDSLLDVVAGAIDPVLADSILQPAEQAQQQMVKDVTDDLTKIFAGIEMPARPNGAQIALQVIQQYTAQEDIAARLQQDESFAARLEKYAGQYTFMMQQAQNAQIGRIGTAPAQMGGMQTQQM